MVCFGRVKNEIPDVLSLMIVIILDKIECFFIFSNSFFSTIGGRRFRSDLGGSQIRRPLRPLDRGGVFR